MAPCLNGSSPWSLQAIWRWFLRGQYRSPPLTRGSDALHLAAVFGISERAAIRDANSAKAFLESSLEQNQWAPAGRVGRRYRLISGSAGKVWLSQIRREDSSG
jgi:hypothetical protein